MKNLSIDSLHIGYKRKTVAANLNAMANSGELTCLIGANGTGKSTLLKTIAGFIPPLGGSIKIGDSECHGLNRKVMARTIGVVLSPGNQSLYGNLSVYDTVATGRMPYTGLWHTLGDKDKRAIDDALKATGAEKLKDRFIDELSDGERQRVMTAKVLTQETPVIIMDEPTAFLDYPGRLALMRLSRELAHKKEKVIIISTHDIELAMRMTDRIWMIDSHSQIRCGTPQEMENDEELINFISGKE